MARIRQLVMVAEPGPAQFRLQTRANALAPLSLHSSPAEREHQQHDTENLAQWSHTVLDTVGA